MNTQSEFHTNPAAARGRQEPGAGRVSAPCSNPANSGQVGRHLTPGLLERRFPGVFRSLQELPGLRPGRGLPSLAEGLKAGLLRCKNLMRLWSERSRTRSVLVRMSEMELKDLGISRSQIIAEVNKPFWRA